MNRLRTLLFACTALTTLALSVGAGADTKLDISNWKEILPEPVYTRLVEESIKNLTSYTASASEFNQKGKKIQAEATNLIVYAEIANRAGMANAGAIRKTAVELLDAAKAKKGDEAKKLAGVLAGYKKLTSGKVEDLDLTTATNLKLIMDVSIKDIDRNLTPFGRLSPTALGAKGKAEEVQAILHKFAALSVATSAHVPSEIPAGKTAKDWLSAAEDMRKHSLAAALAAKEKKQPALKNAIDNLKASCAKCHDDFRKDN